MKNKIKRYAWLAALFSMIFPASLCSPGEIKTLFAYFWLIGIANSSFLCGVVFFILKEIGEEKITKPRFRKNILRMIRAQCILAGTSYLALIFLFPRALELGFFLGEIVLVATITGPFWIGYLAAHSVLKILEKSPA